MVADVNLFLLSACCCVAVVGAAVVMAPVDGAVQAVVAFVLAAVVVLSAVHEVVGFSLTLYSISLLHLCCSLKNQSDGLHTYL